MKFIVLLLLIFNNHNLKSQTENENLLYTCIYKFDWQKDSKKESSIYTDYMKLDIYYSKTVYYSTLKQKGLVLKKEDEKKQTPLEVIMKNKEQYFLDAESQIIYSFLFEKKYEILDKIEAKVAYKVVDTFGIPTWLITNDTLKILNQTCQKATTSYRGRDFIVWFAPNMPLQVGPWKFRGLPGLILQVKDLKNQIQFECISIKNKKTNDNSIMQYSNYKKITLKDLNKLRKQKAEFPMLFAQQQNPEITMSSGGKVITTSTKQSMLYNPIELELK